jgi:hypothetical protein
MLGDLWAHLQIPAGMTAEQARVWLQASEQEATPEAVQEIVELSASMGTGAAAQVMTGASPTPTRSGSPSTRAGCSSWAAPATSCQSNARARLPRPL